MGRAASACRHHRCVILDQQQLPQMLAPRCVLLSRAAMAGWRCWSSCRTTGRRLVQSRCPTDTATPSASRCLKTIFLCLRTPARLSGGRCVLVCQPASTLFTTFQWAARGHGTQHACCPIARSCDWHRHGSEPPVQPKPCSLSSSSEPNDVSGGKASFDDKQHQHSEQALNLLAQSCRQAPKFRHRFCSDKAAAELCSCCSSTGQRADPSVGAPALATI